MRLLTIIVTVLTGAAVITASSPCLGSSKKVPCVSANYKYKECTVKDAHQITKITILKKMSTANCTFYPGPPPAKWNKDDGGIYGIKDGNTMFVHGGCRAQFTVCYSGTCVCTSSGDPHITQYDGMRFHFMGPCKYLLTRYNDPSRPMCEISVEAKHENRGNTRVSWNRYVDIKLHHSNVTIRIGKRPPSSTTPTLTVNGAILPPPYNTASFGSPRFEVYAGPGKMIVDVVDCRKFQVFFDGKRLVWAKVSQSYSDYLTGMCGDCDGNKRDSFKLPNGTNFWGEPGRDKKWGQSWEVPDDSVDAPEQCIVPNTSPCDAYFIMEAENMCQIIKDPSGPFNQLSQIYTVVKEYAQTLYDDCVMDLCNEITDGNNPDQLLCDTLEDFNQWLRANEFEPVNYFPASKCPDNCGPNSEMVIKPPCNPTCQDMAGTPAPCNLPPILTCMCKVGFVLRGGDCVPESECGCRDPDGNYYKPGGSYVSAVCTTKYTCEIAMDGSTDWTVTYLGPCHALANCQITPAGLRDCICESGMVGDGRLECIPECGQGIRCHPQADCKTHANGKKQCICKPGLWGNGVDDCSKKCICIASGDPHYCLFDKQRIHFQGICTYLLTQAGDASCGFRVLVKNKRLAKNYRVSVTRKMTVTVWYYGYNDTLVFDRGQPAKINGVPRFTSKSTPNYVFFVKGWYFIVKNRCGMVAYYHRRRPIVKVVIPEVFGLGAFGLCGDCNRTKDDYNLRNGTDVSSHKDKYSLIGNSWQEHVAGEPEIECQSNIPEPDCTDAQKQEIRTDAYCGYITNPMGPFADCIAVARMGSDLIKDMMFECVYDVCANWGNTTAMVAAACDALSQLEEQCMEQLQVIDINWRSQSLCPPDCGLNMVYKPDITTDQATCKNPSQPQITVGPAVEGCVCLPGYLYDSANEECVLVDNCGCQEINEYYPIGEGYLIADCKTKMTCVHEGGVIFMKQVATGGCDTNEICVNNVCVCKPPYEWDDNQNCVPIPWCFPDPCQNGATCVDEVIKYRCDCPPGFTGNHCETDINECNPDPCENGGTCNDLVNDYSCDCPKGYTGKNCSEDINECNPDPCENGGTCNDLVNNYSCDCPDGYTGKNCSEDINECNPDPCENGGTCNDLVNDYSCDCPKGYTGKNCSEDINECNPDPCENGGTCNDLVNDYSCDCPKGYTGKNCSEDINECNPDPCENGGTCNDLVNDYSCDCPDGYTGKNCSEDINECNPDPCENGGTCNDLVNDYSCDCPKGYTGKNCSEDINDCNPDPCENGGTCNDLVNDYSCDCPDGYTGKNCSEAVEATTTAAPCPGEMTTVSCSSLGFQYHECTVHGAGMIYSVSVKTKLSKSKCTYHSGPAPSGPGNEGLWGYNETNTFWVHRGCRALFNVCFKPLHCPGQMKHVECSSTNYKYKTCAVEGAETIKFVYVETQYSQSSCKYYDGAAPHGYSAGDDGLFGNFGPFVWTHRGCRALFKVCYLPFVCNDEMKTMTCKSKKNKLKYCAIGGGKKITGVAVDKVYTMQTCIFNGNPPPPGYTMGDLGLYGWMPDKIWAHRGCQGKFLVCYKDSVCHGKKKMVKCYSKKNKFKKCKVKGEVLGVTIFKKKSKTCNFHENPPPMGYKKGDPGLYGFKDRYVWVCRGCKAVFEVCYSGKNKCKPNPCLNGGKCKRKGNGYRCKCKYGYYGKHCEHKKCVCIASGDPHYNTFDGSKIHYQGMCKYVLYKGGYGDCYMEVHAKNRPSARRARVSTTEKLYIYVGGDLIMLGQGKLVQLNNVTLSFGEEYSTATYTIRKVGSFIEVKSKCGKTAKYDGKHKAIVTIKGKHGPHARGMCGNCDGKKNDYVTKEGIDVSNEKKRDILIGDSWYVPDPDDVNKNCTDEPIEPPCPADIKAKFNSSEWCGHVRTENGPFAECNDIMEDEVVEDFIDNCIRDLCYFKDDEAEQKEYLCGSASAFSALCYEFDPEEDIDWRTDDFCPMDCGANMEYSSRISETHPTCQNPDSEPLPDDTPREEGCVCVEGFLYEIGPNQQERCIPPDQCGCYLPNGDYLPVNGTYVDSDCHKEYICKEGPHLEENIIGGCDGSYEVCKPVKGIYRCVCRKGLVRDKNGNCVPHNPCDPNPCENGGTCIKKGKKGYKCECPEPYIGKHCKKQKPDPCDPNPCENGGTCIKKGKKGYKCECPEPYIGKHCKKQKPDPCDPNPCENGGTCIKKGKKGYKCECPEPYIGKHCKKQKPDPCDPNPCENGGTCIKKGKKGYKCECPEPYIGKHCKKQKPDPCDPNPCENGGTCIKKGKKGYKCECPEPYIGKHCKKQKPDPCDPNPCENGGTCIKKGKKGYKCECPEPYIGKHCKKQKPDPCDPNPCENGGTCIKKGKKGYKCECPEPYIGKHCKKQKPDPCDPNPCENGGTCIKKGKKGYKCECPEPYIGKHCKKQKPDPCDPNPCENGGTCIKKGKKGYKCECPEPYIGKHCKKQKPDPCDPNPCENGGTCIKMGKKGYKCECPEPYIGKHCKKQKPDPCDPNPCENGGTCIKKGKKGYKCECPEPYIGKHCKKQKPDPCDPNPCENGGTCIKKGKKGYKCECPEPYIGKHCKKQKPDPCDPNPCENGGTCIKKGKKGYKCECPEPYIGKHCKKQKPDPCDPNPCENGGTCIKKGKKGYKCECPEPYIGKHCKKQKPDPCDPNPCENGGTCIKKGKKGYKCECPEPYIGKHCKKQKPDPCDPNPCENGGTCIKKGKKGYKCECPEPYIGKHCRNQKPDPCDPNPCENGGTCIKKGKKGYKCECPEPYIGKHCKKQKPDPCDPNPCENGGTCIKKGKKGYKCECPEPYIGKHCRKQKPGDCDGEMMTVDCDSWDFKYKPCPVGDEKTAILSAKLIDRRSNSNCTFFDGYYKRCKGYRGCFGYSHNVLWTYDGCRGKFEVCVSDDVCGRLNPCKNGGTCINKGYNRYDCCCPEGWEGHDCDKKKLPPKPAGPYLECIMDDDPKGLMYFGTMDRTTSGRKCQPWPARYPHKHAYHKVLAEEGNYCRNRLHGFTGLSGPWCYTMDPDKKWEYCDTIPRCSKNETFPDPPDNPGCYNRGDKGESYEGPVWFAANGNRCKKWPNFPDNYCRNPGGMRNKPFCWTRDGKEDCDIDICALPPPTPGEDVCSVDTFVSVCESVVILRGDCYYRHRLYQACDFTAIRITSTLYDIFMPGVTKELYWEGIGGPDRFTHPTCEITFEVTGFNELKFSYPICGWCAKNTYESFMKDIYEGTKTCPGP